MLVRETSPRNVRRVVTYDLEWTRGDVIEIAGSEAYGLDLRLCGVYDGKSYRSYTTLDEFFDSELVSRNRGAWFYAHAGGLADMIFVLGALIRRGATVKAAFSGSSAIIVHVRLGSDDKNTFHFIDSYWLLRDKLANIAKSIGMKKGNVDFAESSAAELRDYNEQDCVILHNAIRAYEANIWSLGGQLMMTQASCAMNLFRRVFLTRDIQTSDTMNRRAKKSYVGSRVEVLEERCTNALYYDINSSFPFAMTKTSPGQFTRTRERLPAAGSQYLALARITIRDDQWLPPIPYRAKGRRVYFPTGTWEGWFDSIDIELVEESGNTIEKVLEVHCFDDFNDLGRYAETLYERRKEAVDPFQKVVYKLLLNSLYGKFGENPIKRGLRVNPPSIECNHTPRHPQKETNPREPTCMDMVFPGVWLVTDEVDVPHAHVPIASHITAFARRTLYNYMKECREVYYCDTDGFATDTEFPVSPELGGLKLEKRIADGHMVAPKVYRHDMDVKAKGFSLVDKRLITDAENETEDGREKGEKRVAYERFTQLLEGRDIAIDRMTRIREMCNEGDFTPRERTIRKGLRFKTRSKRKKQIGGKTVPWTVEEIDDETF